MNTVKDILNSKGNAVWSVTPQTKVFDALKLMAEKNIGAVLVAENEKVVGIFSERDYARKVAIEGKSSKKVFVQEVMSPRVLFVTSDKYVEECLAIMNEKKIRHLPVFENEKLKGIISIGDVVKALIEHKEFTIEQLEKYITNSR